MSTFGHGGPRAQAQGQARRLGELYVFLFYIDESGNTGNVRHPHKLGFMLLVRRIDEWLRAQQSTADPGRGGAPVLGLLVADEHKEVDRDLVRTFAAWRAPKVDSSDRRREIRCLIDTVHTVPSHNSWMIQVADCVAYLRGRYGRLLRAKGTRTGTYSASEAAVAGLWLDHCQPRVVDDRLWP